MKYLLTFFTLSICFFAFSQSKVKDSSASCIANWKKGEEKVLYIIHNKENYEFDTLKSRINFSYEAHVSILDSNSTGYTVQWIFHLPEAIMQTNPNLADSLPVFEGMKMVFKTSGTGSFIELINWKEVKDAYIKMMEFSLPKNPDSTAKAVLNQTKALFNSKEMVEASLIKEIQLFHLPYGYKFTTKRTIAKTELANPFANEPLPAVQTFKITELRPKEDYFKLVVRQVIDKASAMKMFEGIF